MRHPNHEQVTETIRGWYSNSSPEMGYIKERRRFGVYGRNTFASGGRGNEVLIANLLPDDLPAFLAEVRTYFAGSPARIYIDDHATDEVLRPALIAAGCAWGSAQSYLAHVGAVPVARTVAGLTVERVDETNLEVFTITKIQGFADSEAAPNPDAVQAELPLRRAELADVGCFELARIDGEPAATIAWYEDPDVLVYNLATRASYRGRGIARWLLCNLLNRSYARSCRSVIINADTNDTPIQLYRRLGFTDEVYWRSQYNLPGQQL